MLVRRNSNEANLLGQWNFWSPHLSIRDNPISRGKMFHRAGTMAEKAHLLGHIQLTFFTWWDPDDAHRTGPDMMCMGVDGSLTNLALSVPWIVPRNSLAANRTHEVVKSPAPGKQVSLFVLVEAFKCFSRAASHRSCFILCGRLWEVIPFSLLLVLIIMKECKNCTQTNNLWGRSKEMCPIC